MNQNSYPLKFKNAQLHQRDIDSLNNKQWLTAEAIYFGTQYLIKEIPNGISVLDPSIATFLIFENDFEDLMSVQQELVRGEGIITAINDCQNPNGTHWGVLLFYESQFYLFDSGSNSDLQSSAEMIAKKMLAIIKNDETLIQKDISVIKFNGVPKQTNSYDCGVYSIAIIQRLAECIMKKQEWNFQNITPDYVTNIRLELKNSIQQMLQ
ncbi:unnamed protein product (macronuclear) [Paramecium tetraurelia]|uniref:Ubiquitin-like protease family profile domain-containing protein n=1 Tax=Paramecium tetraurelia TaxID=5888 RepID=A0BIB6_PARTE|nr:uncharacterized protein GSPATT00004655001 [Paramecium tetraurelia]CAK58283.1 unnamed protein product [Paramecium tetraurelia]|eukprot:XP_001425681.1 hypothetical protein (macronuclear) [Paramecium tetraurelia strain d4-2]